MLLIKHIIERRIFEMRAVFHSMLQQSYKSFLGKWIRSQYINTPT